MPSYPVVLKRVSDGLTINGVLADGKSERGSVPYSSDVSGQPGRITFDTFHKGSGQRIHEQNGKYNSASGWDATRRGHSRAARSPAAATVLTTSYPTANDQRRGEIFYHNDGEFIITPRVIYLNEVSVETSPGGAHFTGSYAIWGDRIFFGVEDNGGARTSTAPCRVRNSAGVFANTDFAASYFVIIGSRLFRVIQNATAPKVSVAWTDDLGTSTPTWFTTYTYPTSQLAMDAGVAHGALVVALGGVTGLAGELITMDIGGNFTNILPSGIGHPQIHRLLPYNGGLVAFTEGSLSTSLYIEDVGIISPLLVHPIVDDEIDLPGVGVGGSGSGALGFLAASTLNKIIVRPQFDPENTALIQLDEESNQMTAHSDVLYPAAIPAGARVMAGSMFSARTLRVLYLINTDDLVVKTITLWDGNHAPATNSTFGSTGEFVTAEVLGESYGIKRVLSFSGRTRLLGSTPGTESLQFKLGLISKTGVLTYITLPALTTADGNLGGPFHFEFQHNAEGRAFFVTWVYTSSTGNRLVDIVGPLYLDYVTFPNQRERVSLPLLAGSLQIVPGGGLTKQSRKTMLDNIAEAIKDPSAWTVQWWYDAPDTPSWTAAIESFKSSEVEEAVRPGEGVAVATLVLRKLNTTQRAV